MHAPEEQTIPVFARWFGSWQIRVARRPLAPEELARRYDRMAPRWTRLTDRLGYPRAYRRIFERFFTQYPVPNGRRPLRVLDCGVGTGAFALALADAWGGPLEVTAVDVSQGMVEAAQDRFRRRGLAARVLRASVCALPFADAAFDLVVGAHVLEHLPDPVTALAGMRRVLKPGGWLVICVTRRSLLGAYIHARWRTHRLTPAHAVALCRAAGFRTARIDDPPGGLYGLTSLTCIGHNSHAGSAGREIDL